MFSSVMLAGNVRADLPDGDAPLPQPPDFDFRNVFVDD